MIPQEKRRNLQRKTSNLKFLPQLVWLPYSSQESKATMWCRELVVFIRKTTGISCKGFPSLGFSVMIEL